MVKRYTSRSTGWASVVAYDPGGTTGWCVMSIPPKLLLSANRSLHKSVEHFAAGEIGGGELEQSDQLAELIESWEDAAVVGERFTLRKFLQNRELLSPERINARMEWFLHGFDRHLWWQDPEAAMSRWTDDRLKACNSKGENWYIPGKQHARDAIRHAALFIDRVRDSPVLRSRAWPHLFNSKGELE